MLKRRKLPFLSPAAARRGAVTVFTHLQRKAVRNCSSILIRRNKPTYSTEPNNVKACNSFRCNGLIHRKNMDLERGANRRGVVVVMKWRSSQ